MFIKNKYGKLRLCFNYRALNEIIKKGRHLLPLINEALNRLEGARYFTKLNIKDPYHNIWIKEEDEWKTIFSIKLETYKYLVISFGLCNTAAVLQE